MAEATVRYWLIDIVWRSKWKNTHLVIWGRLCTLLAPKQNHHGITIIAVKKSDMYDVASDMQKINDGFRCSKFGVPTWSALFYRLNALPRVLGGWLPRLHIHFEPLRCLQSLSPQPVASLSSPGQRGSPSAPQRSVWCFLPVGSRRGVQPGWPASTWRRRCRFGPGRRCSSQCTALLCSCMQIFREARKVPTWRA